MTRSPLADQLGDRPLQPVGRLALLPRWRSISTPESICAVGLTLFCPVYFGAEPWVGSNTATPVAEVRARGDAEPADQPGAEIGDDVAVEVGQHHHVVLLGPLDELHAEVVRDPVLELDLGIARRRPRGDLAATARR